MGWREALAAIGIAVGLAAGAALLPASAAAADGAVPAEIDGSINGKPARFVARGDDILLSTAEADRLGIFYLGGKRVQIGEITLYVVLLDAVTVDKATRLGATAGVVASIPAYFAALQAHAFEVMASTRQIEVQVAGKPARVFDFGIGGYVMSIQEAERIGLDYRRGQEQRVGGVAAWLVDAPVTWGAAGSAPALLVTDPEPFFKALQAQSAGRR
jgi:hypothetical protein